MNVFAAAFVEVKTMIKSDCHIHTCFCDGKNTPYEMAQAAFSKGFESLGFSFHSPLPFPDSYAVPENRLGEYMTEIERLKSEFCGKMHISNGVELDRDSVGFNASMLDYVIGSVHQLHFDERIYSVDYSAQMLLNCAKKEFDGSFLRLAEKYYRELSSFVCAANANIVGHFDLIEKFNENCAVFDDTSNEYRFLALEYAGRICDECPDAIFEVNTGAMFRCGRSSPYPSRFILEYLKMRNMRLTLTSDAHCAAAVGFAFDDVSELLRSCGFKSAYVITEKGFEERPL